MSSVVKLLLRPLRINFLQCKKFEEANNVLVKELMKQSPKLNPMLQALLRFMYLRQEL